MRIISRKKLHDYYLNNKQAESPLTEWYYIMRNLIIKDFNQLRNTFNSVDRVHKYTIFNIGGNNYRLIATLHYNTQRCYIREIWTHPEYSKVFNQTKLQRGEI